MLHPVKMPKFPSFLADVEPVTNMEGCYIHHRMENKREHPSLITIHFNKPSCPSARWPGSNRAVFFVCMYASFWSIITAASIRDILLLVLQTCHSLNITHLAPAGVYFPNRKALKQL